MQFLPMCKTKTDVGNIIKSSKTETLWEFSFRSEEQIEKHNVILIDSKLKNKITIIHNGNRMFMGSNKKLNFQWILDDNYNKAQIFEKDDAWHLIVNNYDFDDGVNGNYYQQ
ncbi:hypothetical protein pb186bvf_012268 [Paramecium bursaria]